MARDWVQRTTQHSFIEPALHNDSSIGTPPTAIFGQGLFNLVTDARKTLAHPEVLTLPSAVNAVNVYDFVTPNAERRSVAPPERI